MTAVLLMVSGHLVALSLFKSLRRIDIVTVNGRPTFKRNGR